MFRIRPSSISTYLHCPHKWAQVNINNIPTWGSFSTARGTAIHSAAELIWTESIQTGSKNFNLSAAQDAARDTVKKTLEEEDIRFDPDDFTETKDNLIDSATDGAKAYVSLAEDIDIPMAVEKFLSFDIGDNFEIAGTADFISKTGSIADIKTSSKKTTAAQYIPQLSAYKRLAELNGIQSEETTFQIQNIAFTKTATAGYLLSAQYDKKIISYLIEQIKTRTILVQQNPLEIDLYFPTSPQSYLCTPKYCPFWDQCPATEGRR